MSDNPVDILRHVAKLMFPDREVDERRFQEQREYVEQLVDSDLVKVVREPK